MSEQKTIVITGASSGIGAALTKLFAKDGHQLLVCARNRDGLAETTKGLPSAAYFECDVSSEPDIVRFYDWVKERSSSVDVLIPCAAVMGPIGSIVDIDANEWLDAIKIDLFGTMLAIKYAVPLMKAERRPRILLLSGGGAFDPMPHLSAYGTAKAGAIRLAETLALELAPRNIAVNVFAPGFVATGIFDTMLAAGPERGGELYKVIVDLLKGWRDTDLQRPLELARFLISDRAAPLTGKTISARYDPWEEPEFIDSMKELLASRLYATQRTNVEHLKGQAFADRLAEAQARKNARNK
jgi:3-oxoacyl-[acyl-carrier protein] reductase